jgi:hypothetical protein
VTRFRITLDCYEAEFRSEAAAKAGALPMKWVRPGDLERYPLSSTGRTLARLVEGNTR